MAAALLLSSCENESIRASGEVTTENYAFSGYTNVKIGGAFDVIVEFSETNENVQIEANENLQEKLIVRIEGNSLVIRPEDNLNIKGNAILKAYITVPALTTIELSGASTLNFNTKWIVNDGQLRSSGASSISGEIEATNFEISASGASDINLFGSIANLEANLSGSSDLRDFDLQIQFLDIDLSGSSDAFLSVAQQIEIDASGSSSLNYNGNPAIARQNLSGGSALNKRN